MRNLSFAFLVVGLVPLLLPAEASAQRRFGGAKDADFEFAGSAPSGPTISRGDLEKMSPLKMFIDKKKDLKLNDTQLAAMAEADTKLRESNAGRYEDVDSLKKLLKPKTSGTPSVEDQTRMALAREAMMQTLSEIRVSYDEAAKTTVAGMDSEQQKTATALLEKQQEDTQDMLRQKLGGGRGGGGAGSGRGGRVGRPPA